MPISGPPLAENEIITLHEVLRSGLDSKPDDTAFVSALTRRSWRELEAESDHYARQLLALGLKPGDRVASLMPNREALLVHYLGCVKARLVATPLNYRYMAPEIDHALEVTDASILLAHAERDADLEKSTLAGRLPLGRISYEADDGRTPTFEQLMEASTPAIELPPPLPSDPSFIFFTSGSTGKPKGVTHSHETFGRLLASAVKGYEMTPDDVVLPASSISHIGGLGFCFIAFAAGAQVVNARTFDGDELLPLLREHRPTFVWMLPAALFVLERDHDAKGEDFASIRVCVSGGDKVSGMLETEYTRLTGSPIDEIYGMSEIGFTTASPVSGDYKIGSVGQLMPGYMMSIRDENDAELGTGEEGQLWIKASMNMIGYWNRPDATEETIQDGWLATGDVMRVDEEGYLWFCGRRKQIIIHDGSNICPQEVEGALLEHAAVASAGVVGVNDLMHGENVRAYITLREGANTPTSQELIRFARERIGYKTPEEIVVLDEMPLNATGKVDRVILKRMAAADHASHE